MSDDATRDHSPEFISPEFIDTPAGAQMLQTLGQAAKTPGRCACGEHPDPDEHPDAVHD